MWRKWELEGSIRSHGSGGMNSFCLYPSRLDIEKRRVLHPRSYLWIGGVRVAHTLERNGMPWRLPAVMYLAGVCCLNAHCPEKGNLANMDFFFTLHILVAALWNEMTEGELNKCCAQITGDIRDTIPMWILIRSILNNNTYLQNTSHL